MEKIEIPEFESIILMDDDVNISNSDVSDSTFQNDDTPIAAPVVDANNDQTQTSTTSEYSETADPIAIATFEQMYENGVFADDDKEKFNGTWESLAEKLDNLPQKVFNNLLQQSSEYSQALLRFAVASPNITREDFLNFTKTYLDETETPQVSNIETMDDAREYLKTVYTQKVESMEIAGNKAKFVDAMLNDLEEEGNLLEEAQKELQKSSQLKAPKTEQLIAEKEKEYNTQIQEQQKFVAKVSEELDNLGWKPTKVEQIRKNFGNVNTVLSDVYKNPKSLIKLVDFLTYYKDGDIDYSKFINSVQTPAAQDFKSRFEQAANSPTLSTKSNFKNPNPLDNDATAII